MPSQDRARLVEEARIDLSRAMIGWYQLYERALTRAELILLLSEKFGTEVSGVARSAVSEERENAGG